MPNDNNNLNRPLTPTEKEQEDLSRRRLQLEMNGLVIEEKRIQNRIELMNLEIEKLRKIIEKKKTRILLSKDLTSGMNIDEALKKHGIDPDSPAFKGVTP